MLQTIGIFVLLELLTCGQARRIIPERTVFEFDGVDTRRPIWNVAHMVNALYQIDYYVNEGANSVEFDVSFDWDGKAKHTFHGFPCDCFRSCSKYEDIVLYINYLRQLTTPGDPKFRKELVLLFADMKLSGLSNEARYKAGIDIADKLIQHYWLGGEGKARSYILLSIPSVEHANFITGFYHELGKRGLLKYKDMIGVDFSGNEALDTIERSLQSLQIEDHIWQGDGITNCLPRNTVRLREAIQRRDRSGKTYIDKVYWWTLDKMATMRTVLRLGVDGMITNYPNRLISVLSEDEFSRTMKLATIDDNPWVKYKPLTAAMYESSYVTGRGGNITDSETVPDAEELLYNC